MAIYQAIDLIPSSIIGGAVIDATQINIFSFVCQGTTTDKYNVKIYKVSDNTQVYTTGDVPLSPVKYNNEQQTFNLPANTLTNGIQYKWTVTTYQGVSSATSLQAVFWANSNATLTMTVPAIITAPSYTFTATYTQTDNVPLSYYYYVLSDSSGEIDRTNLIFSGNITYSFTGFANNNIYNVQVFGATNNGYVFSSSVYSFSVSYARPNLNVVPTVIQDCNTSIATLTWKNAIQKNGYVNGTYSFIQNYQTVDNWALNLDANSYYYSDIDIPLQMNVEIPYVPNGFVSGKMVELLGVGTKYEFGYDSTLNRFYFNINGITGYSNIISLPSYEFFIILNPTTAYVKIDNIIYTISYM